MPLENESLKEILLRNNQIMTIPKEIKQLKNLRKLDLRGNQIDDLPKQLLYLDKLERLDLRWNPIEKLPDWTTELRERNCIIYI